MTNINVNCKKKNISNNKKKKKKIRNLCVPITMNTAGCAFKLAKTYVPKGHIPLSASHLLCHSVVRKSGLVRVALLLELHVTEHQHSRHSAEHGCKANLRSGETSRGYINQHTNPLTHSIYIFSNTLPDTPAPHLKFI